MNEIKKEILDLVMEANAIIPKYLLPNLVLLDEGNGITKWHQFEFKVWEIGEIIRQKLNSNPQLRKDKDLGREFIAIAKNKNAKRGRQSFIMLLACKPYASFAAELLSELKDPDVTGQVIFTWRKMQVSTFIKYVSPYLNSSARCEKVEAKKYLNKFNQA